MICTARRAETLSTRTVARLRLWQNAAARPTPKQQAQIPIPIIDTNGIRIGFEETGVRGNPSVLLLHGLGCQLVQWPDSLIAGIVAAGFHVVRIDNRDVGLSDKLDRLGTVNLMTFFMPAGSGPPPVPPFTLADMSDDVAGVMDGLSLSRAHVVGVSMGGMIAQQLAIRHPQRVLSLTSIMSTSGAPNLPAPEPAAIGSIMSVPASSQREGIIAHVERSWDLIGGSHYKSTEVGMGRKTAEAFDRCRHPPGILRQMAAVLADVGRADALSRIGAPTLVLHGEIDPLVPLGCGEDTARRIPGAKIKVIPKMGHDLPDPLIQEVLELLVTHWRAAAAPQ